MKIINDDEEEDEFGDPLSQTPQKNKEETATPIQAGGAADKSEVTSLSHRTTTAGGVAVGDTTSVVSAGEQKKRPNVDGLSAMFKPMSLEETLKFQTNDTAI